MIPVGGLDSVWGSGKGVVGQEQKQIPSGDDNQKGNCNDNDFG